MFSTKSMRALACVFMIATGAAHAEPKAATPRAQKGTAQQASARVPSADLDMGAEASTSTGAASSTAAPAQAAAQAASAPTPVAMTSGATDTHLSIEQVDRIARSSIARQLAGNQGVQLSGGMPNGAAQVPAAASAPAIVVGHPAASRPRAEPVRFVGAFSDAGGQSVLYEYRNASYPAHVGARLLNGWTVKSVNGFVVTVADGTGKGARTWTETISGGTPAQDNQPTAAMNVAARGVPDLSGPLPPNMPLSAIGR
ncbi:hypothetical protein [Paraburkholderia aromaticivorans]|uniref:Type IV pilus biogenesis protein PilP n=1 Tax=Paraburkholderia aromaticivorans TaxID=2026199 RepID=A0A248VYY6_9BURK|nr:hypothetical protein [Paraburkholderia aromaticivorans]ASW04218.1 hypothetical protein CJU94_39425 [Paraburkholderia aromaticivorans]